jgi:protein tyrosine phosphatase
MNRISTFASWGFFSLFIFHFVFFLADDHSLVPLKPKINKKTGDGGFASLPPGDVKSADYINANFVDGWNRPNAYIATQGPLPKTTPAFWRMVWEHKVKTVVMITNLVERGRVSQRNNIFIQD